MILAMTTGWTPDVLRELPTGFRSRCHWVLYVRALIGDDGLPHVDIPAGAPPSARMQAMKAQVEIATVRDFLFPEDERV